MARDPEDELELLELLGEGAYGAVYKARRFSDDQLMAVKIIPIDGGSDLRKELDIMRSCQCPYLVQLHDVFQKDAEAWLLLDYCSGGSASDVMEACGVTLTEEEARCCVAWCLLGLEFLHSRRKLHRDVKAGNVLLAAEGKAKLADFGVSREVTSSAGNKAATVIGTPYWMAPEVIQEVPYDGRADVWSLGITAIELVEGHPPLHKVHPMRAIFMIPGRAAPTLKEPTKWSAEFQDFVSQCLNKRMEERPTAAELLNHPWVKEAVATISSANGLEGSPALRALVDRHANRLAEHREAASLAKLAAEEQTQRRTESSMERRKATLRQFSGGVGARRSHGGGGGGGGGSIGSPQSTATSNMNGNLSSNAGGGVSPPGGIGSPQSDDAGCSSVGSCLSTGSVVRYALPSAASGAAARSELEQPSPLPLGGAGEMARGQVCDKDTLKVSGVWAIPTASAVAAAPQPAPPLPRCPSENEAAVLANLQAAARYFSGDLARRGHGAPPPLPVIAAAASVLAVAPAAAAAVATADVDATAVSPGEGKAVSPPSLSAVSAVSEQGGEPASPSPGAVKPVLSPTGTGGGWGGFSLEGLRERMRVLDKQLETDLHHLRDQYVKKKEEVEEMLAHHTQHAASDDASAA